MNLNKPVMDIPRRISMVPSPLSQQHSSSSIDVLFEVSSVPSVPSVLSFEVFELSSTSISEGEGEGNAVGATVGG